MMSSLARVADSAENISRAFTSQGSGDPTADIVNMNIDSLAYKANAKVAQVGEDLSQSVLDLLA